MPELQSERLPLKTYLDTEQQSPLWWGFFLESTPRIWIKAAANYLPQNKSLLFSHLFQFSKVTV